MSGQADSSVTDEVLREALGTLPVRHRECLVLHYLEGQPVVDAAAALGISEGAFKVRLHRARRALRVHLERRMEESLGRLGPRRSLAPGIMASIALKTAATDPSGVAPGMFAFLGASVAKLLPLPILFLLVPVGALVAGLGANHWATSVERRNYRDASGFRRRLYDENWARQQARGAVWVFLVFVFLVVGSRFSQPWVNEVLLGTLVLACLPGALAAFRQARWTGRVSGPVGMALATFPLVLSFGLGTVWNLPQWFMGLVWGGYFLAMMFLPPARRVRLDENLFLRLRLGLISAQAGPAAETGIRPWTRARLAEFGRFGAREGVFSRFRSVSGGLRLRLCPVVSGWRDDFGGWWTRADSHVTIHEDGRVAAVLGSRDAADLDRMGIAPGGDAGRECSETESAIRNSMTALATGDAVAALRHLGQVPDGEIFVIDPRKTGHARMQRWVGAAGLVFAGAMIVLPRFFSREAWRETPWEPVTLSVGEARARFELLGRDRGDQRSRHRFDGVTGVLSRRYILPPVDWLSPEASEFLRTNRVSFGASSSTPDPAPDPDRVLQAFWSWQDAKAIVLGWESLRGSESNQRSKDEWREALGRSTAGGRAEILRPDIGVVANTGHSRTRLEPVRWRVAALRRLGVLDLFETRPLVALVKGLQIVPGGPLPSGCDPNLDRSVWTGLFATGGSDPIEEAYVALSLLEELGALATIDGEACVAGFLRLHRGRGLFDARQPWERPFTRKSRVRPSPIHLDGSARNTFAAWESLRMLGALGRVPDLGEWRFRVPKGSQDTLAHPSGAAVWQVVEAVLLRERAASQ
ncbi:MAG: sigma factor-like helix-turn-helix DNA-binding protein [Limisphaerales bacterium]